MTYLISSAIGMDVPDYGGINRLGGGKVFATDTFLSSFFGGKKRVMFTPGGAFDRNEW